MDDFLPTFLSYHLLQQHDRRERERERERDMSSLFLMNQTHVSRVAPDCDLRRTLDRLSYSAGAKANKELISHKWTSQEVLHSGLN